VSLPARVKFHERKEFRRSRRPGFAETLAAWRFPVLFPPVPVPAAPALRRNSTSRPSIIPGELAFHYCHVPEGQLLTKPRLLRAAGLRWPVEEDFKFSDICMTASKKHHAEQTPYEPRVAMLILRIAGCRQELLRPGSVPGPAVHRDPPSRRAGHGRPGDLRRHSRPAQRSHRYPGPTACRARLGKPHAG
jgi:hypothetical protein